MTSEGPVASATRTGTRIAVRVIPRARRAMVGGVRDGRLLVRVTAPPVDQAANRAVIVALAAALDLPTRAVTIVSGGTSRNKDVHVEGLSAADVEWRIGAASQR